jgi:hypothetical protein
MSLHLETQNARITFERLMLFVTLSAVIGLSVCYPPFSEQRFSLCLFKNLFGIPCPGCGMGRAFLFIGHGEISKAFHLNPNSLPAFILVLLFWINGAMSLVFKKEVKIRRQIRKIGG